MSISKFSGKQWIFSWNYGIILVQQSAKEDNESMKKMIAWLSVITLLLLSPAAALAQEEEDYESLASLAAAYGFKLGAPLSYGQMVDHAYQDFVAKHFNSITTTNEMKAYSLLDQSASRKTEDGMPAMDYRKADQMVAWARKNGIAVRGHTLVWDAYMNDWFFREGYSMNAPYADQETIKARTESYITQVITHFEEKFPGVVYCWDVVNEAVGDNAGEYKPADARHLRTKRNGGDNLFQKYMGDDYVELAFLYAKNAVEALGADTKLYYNDYNAYFGDKAKAIRALAKSVNSYAADEEGNPRQLMDGIGMQGYIGGYGTQDGCLIDSHVDMIKNEILNYAAMGLEVQITEMAVRNFDPAQADKHTAFYAKLFTMFTSLCQDGETPLKAVSIWGLTDNPNEPKGTYVYNLNSPYGGLVTETYQYKDAFKQVYAVLKQE
uniref:Beta-xylanase n=1 Tax=uncultured bacterium Ad_142_N07 TaxID=1489286 RepID=A0A3S7I567_9BACT|nr:putative endoxylanase [uncultured bacterium Ad_142_N07]